jgi:5-hydroxyisourate hydrolase
MSGISTHILDLSLGRPAAGVAVSLQRHDPTDWQTVAQATTNGDGRCAELLARERVLPATYRLIFAIEPYFAREGRKTLFPEIIIVFEVTEGEGNYHIPLLLNPFGYSTYRGS